MEPKIRCFDEILQSQRFVAGKELSSKMKVLTGLVVLVVWHQAKTNFADP